MSDITIELEKGKVFDVASVENMLQDTIKTQDGFWEKIRHIDTRSSYLVLIASMLCSLLLWNIHGLNLSEQIFKVHISLVCISLTVLFALIVSVCVTMCLKSVDIINIDHNVIKNCNNSMVYAQIVSMQYNASLVCLDSVIKMYNKKRDSFTASLSLAIVLTLFIIVDVGMVAIISWR